MVGKGSRIEQPGENSKVANPPGDIKQLYVNESPEVWPFFL